jgi:hypothetical protein
MSIKKDRPPTHQRGITYAAFVVKYVLIVSKLGEEISERSSGL